MECVNDALETLMILLQLSKSGWNKMDTLRVEVTLGNRGAWK